jgi:outer membrane protein X
MIKFFLSTVCFCLFSLFTQAQAPNYVDWEWDILKAGWATPTSGDDLSNGFIWSTELRYNLRDDISIGIGFDGAFFSDEFDQDNVDIDLAGSFQVNTDYYLSTTSGTRGFFGLGIGSFGDGKLTIRNGEAEDIIEGTDSFGIAPRAGFELGHGRLLAQYNWAFKEETTNYFSVTLALTLWGGYKG